MPLQNLNLRKIIATRLGNARRNERGGNVKTEVEMQMHVNARDLCTLIIGLLYESAALPLVRTWLGLN